MGYKLIRFHVIPEENEQIDAKVKLHKEPRSVIHGVVVDEHNKPVKDAVVKLLRENCHDHHKLDPITHTFTDDCGQFLFGPLCPHVKYIVKVWHCHIKSREIIVEPEHCDEPCKCEDECHDNCDHEHEHHRPDDHHKSVPIEKREPKRHKIVDDDTFYKMEE